MNEGVQKDFAPKRESGQNPGQSDPKREAAKNRPDSHFQAKFNRFQFGAQTITTKVAVMVPRALASPAPHVDVTAAMDEQPRSRSPRLTLLPADSPPGATVDDADPFASVEVE